jgi:hypothetical protein
MKKKEWKWTFRSCSFEKLNGDQWWKCTLLGVFWGNNDKKVDHNNPEMMHCSFLLQQSYNAYNLKT